MITPVTLARALAAAFEHRTRDNGETFHALRADSPEWMTDAVHAAHGGMLPNDWRYRAISDAAQRMSDSDDFSVPQDGYDEPDAYTSDRIAWLGSHIDRPGYCDAAQNEWGLGPADIIDRIGSGQAYELCEVWNLLAAFLTEEADRQAEGEEG
jgi:hypothetical protein